MDIVQLDDFERNNVLVISLLYFSIWVWMSYNQPKLISISFSAALNMHLNFMAQILTGTPVRSLLLYKWSLTSTAKP